MGWQLSTRDLLDIKVAFTTDIPDRLTVAYVAGLHRLGKRLFASYNDALSELEALTRRVEKAERLAEQRANLLRDYGVDPGTSCALCVHDGTEDCYRRTGDPEVYNCFERCIPIDEANKGNGGGGQRGPYRPWRSAEGGKSDDRCQDADAGNT